MEKEGLGLEITELRLGLGQPGGCCGGVGGGSGIGTTKNSKKRGYLEIDSDGRENIPAKSQVVGWPPVCSYRIKNRFNDHKESKMYKKVSMDGAPFLRKIDLNNYKGYDDLTIAFEKLFNCYGIGKLLKDLNSSEYIPIYEDKDGDWMLVGDVPWEMFTDSCKRLRIMKKSDAKGFGIHMRIFVKKALEEEK